MFNMAKEHRAFTRVPFDRLVRWYDESDVGGESTLVDIGRGGLSLSLGHYLRPGPTVHFEFSDIFYREEPVVFDARIAWCRSDPESPERFHAGFQVIHHEPASLGRLSEVFYAALAQKRRMASA